MAATISSSSSTAVMFIKVFVWLLLLDMGRGRKPNKRPLFAYNDRSAHNTPRSNVKRTE